MINSLTAKTSGIVVASGSFSSASIDRHDLVVKLIVMDEFLRLSAIN